MATRSSTLNMCFLELCTNTLTIRWSKMVDALLMISRWPKVTGSKLPG